MIMTKMVILLRRSTNFCSNKLHFAVTVKAAAEIIYDRADAKPTMGLAAWKDSPDGKNI